MLGNNNNNTTEGKIVGLDMYLKASRYVSGWEFVGADERARYQKLIEVSGLKPEQLDKGSPSGSIELVVGYWRKANAIHDWFVKNVQDGLDKCEPHRVEREQLEALKQACQAVLAAANPETKVVDLAKAQEILPTREGFFFGGTEYDEWYLRDMQDTIKIIDRVLTLGEEWAFTYRSSW